MQNSEFIPSRIKVITFFHQNVFVLRTYMHLRGTIYAYTQELGIEGFCAKLLLGFAHSIKLRNIVQMMGKSIRTISRKN
jgi:hypothetical protein